MEYVIIFLSLIIIFKIIFKPCIKKRAAKLPSFPYKLFYTDEKNCENKSIICSKLLISEKYNICGKPDLVYKNIFTGNLIVVELKSGKIGKKKNPRHGDLMQLVTYFIILQDCFKIKPSCGFLIYSDCMFTVKNKFKLRNEIFLSLQNMRNMLKSGNCSHKKNYAVCKNCFCKCVCKK